MRCTSKCNKSVSVSSSHWPIRLFSLTFLAVLDASQKCKQTLRNIPVVTGLKFLKHWNKGQKRETEVKGFRNLENNDIYKRKHYSGYKCFSLGSGAKTFTEFLKTSVTKFWKIPWKSKGMESVYTMWISTCIWISNNLLEKEVILFLQIGNNSKATSEVSRKWVSFES